ncbi:hypothetical protein CPB85DRAFT_1568063 [Mucidula mucida]|nr:hypothetical protein CPB85DRAFT_1568063 [Mucidula mucida]
MTIEPLVFRWGIISTGQIATALIVGPSGRSKDVGRRVLSPAISLFAIIRRDVHDVVYKIAAVGSISVASAEKFIATVAGGDKAIKAYGTYEEVYTDKVCQLLSFVVGDDSGKIAFQDVDAIYIGTPHTCHYINALDAIKAKKHVVCEKPVTCNLLELKEVAKENGVFSLCVSR